TGVVLNYLPAGVDGLLAALAAAGAALGGGADGAGAGAETAFGGIAGPTEPVLIDVIANLLAYEP
ncbi:MAG: hypothetical protein NWQ70_07400, partial [Burkholderiaceae bacterium]|nr:hypothetical protein [Burkholderiaceae bacterium]